MKYRIKLLITFLFLISTSLYASKDVPTVSFHGINLITGKLQEDSIQSDRFQYESYVVGHNDVNGTSVRLEKGDFRIGRIKIYRQWNDSTQSFQPIAYFFYAPSYTEIVNASNDKTIYRYSPKERIEAVEHYHSLQLYRKERIFWDSTSSYVVSRVLEDGEGNAQLCCQFQYNKKGQIIKETLFGNLSGQCTVPLSIQFDGTPRENGTEHYSTTYEYKNDLIIREIADNGSVTLYDYDPKTKQCISKMRQENNHIVSRHFYFYDNMGLLTRVIMDDGSGKLEKDLSGVNARKIISIQSCLQEAAFGQPLVTENKYYDLESHQEILLEKNCYTYSEKGQLIQQEVYDANGEFYYSIQMSYDEKGQLVQTIDSRGKTIDAAHETSQYRYNGQNQRIAFIDAEGNETKFSHDPFGRLIKTSYPQVLDQQDQPVTYETRQEYDIRNNVIRSHDANGNVTSTSYTIRNKPIDIIYPDGSSEHFVYFLDGNLKELKSKDGHTVIYERDSFGRVLHSNEYAENGELLGSLFYTYQGSYLASISDEKTFTTTFIYDKAGRQVGVKHETKEGVKRREWSYDAKGEKNATKEWFGSGQHDYVSKIEEKDSLRFEDAQGNSQKQIKSPQENKETIFSQTLTTDNALGQCVRQEEIVDTNGLREITTFDALGRIESIEAIDPFGIKIRERHLRYDGNGNKVLEKHLVMSKGETLRTFTIAWFYDAANRLIGIQEGTDKITRYKYNQKGQLTEVVKPDGKLISYSYDYVGRPVRLTASDGSFDYHYTYDENHRLTKAEDHILDYCVGRSYNDFNELIEENFNSQFTIKNQYDLAGRRTEITLPDHTKIAYMYEGALLKNIQRLNGQGQSLYQHAYQYENGKVNQSELINSIGSINYSYDQLGRPSQIKSEWWSETIPEGGFDQYHRLREMSIQDPLEQTHHYFNYTTDHQLSSEEGYFTHRYEQDSLYNCLSVDGKPCAVNDLNQVTQIDETILKYDLNGNLIQNDDIQFEYDALNRLVRVTKNQESAWGYRYDAFHRRIAQLTYEWKNDEWVLQKTENYLYDGDKEIGQIDQNGTIKELRILGQGKGAEIGAAVALELHGNVYVPIHDHQGSVRCLIDVQTKQVAEFYRYTAFGREEIFNSRGDLLNSTEVGNPWRFSSKRCHTPTGLICFGKRDYDPLLGRWISPDPLFFCDTPNLYAFVQNDPLTLCDPYGQFSVSSVLDYCVTKFFNYCYSLQEGSDNMFLDIAAELELPEETISAFERIGKKLMFGDLTLMLLGYKCDEVHLGIYGNGEISDKVRITFINGMFTTGNTIFDNLELLSQSHGGNNIHYIFRPTEGWVRDIYQGILIKLAYSIGYRSTYTYLLANTWKKMIEEMGGVNGGGIIIHYAHSLGGTETDRARQLLTPEEQRMIRVITIGSSTLIRDVGFASVVNYVCPRDGVASIFLEPFGHIRNYFDPNSNVIFRGNFFEWPCFPCDHLMTGRTYQPVVIQLGEQFLIEFAPR